MLQEQRCECSSSWVAIESIALNIGCSLRVVEQIALYGFSIDDLLIEG